MPSSFPYTRRLAVALLLSAIAPEAKAQTTLGSFSFSDGLFGTTLAHSDGGAHATRGALYTGPLAPTGAGFLTGVGFDTGIANINRVVYTIGYGTGIVNNDGNDLGVVTARFSGDAFDIAVSTDGLTFGPTQTYGASTAVGTGVFRSYRFAGYAGVWTTSLFVQPLDLSSFGVGSGQSIVAVRITGYPELDLVRVAGFTSAVQRMLPPVIGDQTPSIPTLGDELPEEEVPGEELPASEAGAPATTVTPEPSSYALMAAGLVGLVGLRQRRRQR